jgi:hypothetical protein
MGRGSLVNVLRDSYRPSARAVICPARAQGLYRGIQAKDDFTARRPLQLCRREWLWHVPPLVVGVVVGTGGCSASSLVCPSVGVPREWVEGALPFDSVAAGPRPTVAGRICQRAGMFCHRRRSKDVRRIRAADTRTTCEISPQTRRTVIVIGADPLPQQRKARPKPAQ